VLGAVVSPIAGIVDWAEDSAVPVAEPLVVAPVVTADGGT